MLFFLGPKDRDITMKNKVDSSLHEHRIKNEGGDGNKNGLTISMQLHASRWALDIKYLQS